MASNSSIATSSHRWIRGARPAAGPGWAGLGIERLVRLPFVSSVQPVTARKTWRSVEPVHAMIYFSPEATERYVALGLEGQVGYFASRAAPMGPVGAEVVIATFFNFNPD